MKKQIVHLTVLLCLFGLGLCGCAGAGGDDEPLPHPTLLGQAAELDEETVLLTVDGREVPAWRYLYWLAFTCDQVRARYEDAGLSLDWKIPVTGGTLGDYAKDQALADTALYATVENWGETYGCALTEEERAGLAERWIEQSEARGGEAAYLAELADLGLDRDRAEELEAVGMLYGKLYQLYGASDSPMAALREHLNCLTVDRILVAAGGEEEREEARQRASELFSRLNGGADLETLFSALAAEGDDPAGPRTFIPGDGTLSTELEEAAAALEEGQCSGILESAEGFSILRRLPAENAALPADGTFDQLLQQAAENSLVQTTADYGRLDAAAFDKALRTLRAEGAE